MFLIKDNLSTGEQTSIHKKYVDASLKNYLNILIIVYIIIYKDFMSTVLKKLKNFLHKPKFKEGDTIIICPRDVGWANFIHNPPTPDLIYGFIISLNGEQMIELINSTINNKLIIPIETVIEDDFHFNWKIVDKKDL